MFLTAATFMSGANPRVASSPSAFAVTYARQWLILQRRQEDLGRLEGPRGHSCRRQEWFFVLADTATATSINR